MTAVLHSTPRARNASLPVTPVTDLEKIGWSNQTQAKSQVSSSQEWPFLSEAPDMPVIQDRVTVSVETIMLATDFSPAAEKAASFAKALARRFASTVEIAHIFNPSTVDSYEEAIVSMPVDERRQNNQDRLEAIQYDFLDAGIKVRSVSREGHRPAHDILEL